MDFESCISYNESYECNMKVVYFTFHVMMYTYTKWNHTSPSFLSILILSLDSGMQVPFILGKGREPGKAGNCSVIGRCIPLLVTWNTWVGLKLNPGTAVVSEYQSFMNILSYIRYHLVYTFLHELSFGIDLLTRVIIWYRPSYMSYHLV